MKRSLSLSCAGIIAAGISLRSRPRMKGMLFAAGMSTMTAAPECVAGQAPADCKLGQAIADANGNQGEIFGGQNYLCLIKYKDGRTQRWVTLKDLSIIAPPATSPMAAPNISALGEGVAEGVKVLRPTGLNRLVYRADALGHVVVTTAVNGAPVKFLVDTGATLVSLSPKDAAAAGIRRNDLTFDRIVHTGNGPVKAAFAQIREIRIERFELKDIQAAVIENLQQSVLGMSFLHRLKAFEMRNGELSMTW